MGDFIKGQGPAFLAHLLRRLSDEFVRGCQDFEPDLGLTAPPRTGSTLLALDEKGPLSITELAGLLRQSHPLVITWVRQLKSLGLVTAGSDPNDKRRTVIALTAAGREEAALRRCANRVVAAAYARMFDEEEADMFDALWRVEEACRRQPFAERLRREAARMGITQDA